MSVGRGGAALLGVGADDNLDESVSTSRRQWIQNLRFGCPCGALDTVHGLPSGGSGDLNTEREFPSDKVYRRDDGGIVRVESFSLQGLAFVVIHIVLDVGPVVAVPRWCMAALVPEVLTALPSVWPGDPHNDAITVFSPSRG